MFRNVKKKTTKIRSILEHFEFCLPKSKVQNNGISANFHLRGKIRNVPRCSWNFLSFKLLKPLNVEKKTNDVRIFGRFKNSNSKIPFGTHFGHLLLNQNFSLFTGLKYKLACFLAGLASLIPGSSGQAPPAMTNVIR